jgi:Amt family ammonium transporter
MSQLRWWLGGLLWCCCITLFSASALAQPDAAKTPMPAGNEAAGESAKIKAEETAAEKQGETPPPIEKSPDYTANNAWILTSSALVLFMTVPGLAMFYGGLVRSKNVLSVIMQCMFLMGLMGVLWALYGYSLSFGGTNPYFGDGSFVALDNVTPKWDPSKPADKAVTTYTFNIKDSSGKDVAVMPLTTHMLFQGMFFIITPALICGAFAERMKFSAMVVFSILWGTLIYTPLCHWVWGGGILAYHTKSAIMGGALDFAGGTVVHISSGVSALVCCLVIGKRVGFGVKPMPPHNLTYTALGAGMLWVGWFGFNAGSALAADDIAASAFAATHFSAAAATVAWASAEWFLRGKPSMLGAASGAVAGLVCVTPAAGYVTPMSAIIMGLAAGLFCFFTCTTMKNKFGYDDSLDAFGVHGLGGTLGAILTGIFATRAVNNLNSGNPVGLVDGAVPQGETTLIVGQIVATLITWGVAIVGSFILLKVIDFTIGLRVSEVEEQEGLDITQHGEEGYIDLGLA